MYTDAYEVLSGSIYAQQVYCMADHKAYYVRHRVLFVSSVSLRKAIIRRVLSTVSRLSIPSLAKSSVRNRESRAYLFSGLRTLQAFSGGVCEAGNHTLA